MKRNDLIQTLQLETGISPMEARAVVELFFGGLLDALGNEEERLFNFYINKKEEG
jgi:nucleoid DNA-binding protein